MPGEDKQNLRQGRRCLTQDSIPVPTESEASANLPISPGEHVIENINKSDLCGQSVIDSGVQCDRCTQ